MSTRGAIGVVVDGEKKVAYNHFDSYPKGLGNDIVNELKLFKAQVKKTNKLSKTKTRYLSVLKNIAKEVKFVKEELKPDMQDLKTINNNLEKNLFVSTFQPIRVELDITRDWCELLRPFQGKLIATLYSGYMFDANSFMKDSLFCEWAYIMNFDTKNFEIYEACSLVKSFPLNAIPENWIKQL